MTATATPATVHVTLEDHVATLVLDAPRRNAMSPELGTALREAVARVNAMAGVRAVVLAGANDTFSAGGDLAMLARLRTVPREEARAFMLDFYARYLSVTELAMPVVAAVEGAAIGAGLCVALACDLCVVGEGAKLAVNFVQLGLHPGMGATYLVPLRAGAQRGAELLYTGRRFDGRDAVALGLAVTSAPDGSARVVATGLARTIAASAPLAVRDLKRAIGLDRSALARALAHEADAQATSYGSADLGEGLAAAGERRAAVFTGA